MNLALMELQYPSVDEELVNWPVNPLDRQALEACLAEQANDAAMLPFMRDFRPYFERRASQPAPTKHQDCNYGAFGLSRQPSSALVCPTMQFESDANA